MHYRQREDSSCLLLAGDPKVFPLRLCFRFVLFFVGKRNRALLKKGSVTV